MSTFRNRVHLIGRLGADPEVKTFGESKKVARMRIAYNEYYKKNDGSFEEKTHWFTIVAWGKLVELTELNFKKGHEVIVEGRLSTNEYEDKDGNKKSSVEIVASQILPLNKLNRPENSEVAQEASTVNEDLPF
jgi:single-strand DNA-binding protein